jgi:hypothetical protein
MGAEERLDAWIAASSGELGNRLWGFCWVTVYGFIRWIGWMGCLTSRGQCPISPCLWKIYRFNGYPVMGTMKGTLVWEVHRGILPFGPRRSGVEVARYGMSRR